MNDYYAWLEVWKRLVSCIIRTPPPQINFASGGIVSSGGTAGNGKPQIRTSGMHGFSEEGAPREWDTAMGEVRGYRWWVLNVPAHFAGYLDEPEIAPSPSPLTGANRQSWLPGRNEAVCTSTDSVSGYRIRSWDELIEGEVLVHEPPETRARCGCGFWAYFDKDLNVSTVFGGHGAGKPLRVGSTIQIPIFGVVRGTGRVIIGEKGFRSQYAEITGLCVPDIAVTELSWFTVKVNRETPAYNTACNTAWQAFRNGPGWYSSGAFPPGTFGSSGAPEYREENASHAELLARVATVEALLGEQYPDAKIMSDQAALVKYFPPDKYYA